MLTQTVSYEPDGADELDRSVRADPGGMTPAHRFIAPAQAGVILGVTDQTGGGGSLTAITATAPVGATVAGVPVARFTGGQQWVLSIPADARTVILVARTTANQLARFVGSDTGSFTLSKNNSNVITSVIGATALSSSVANGTWIGGGAVVGLILPASGTATIKAVRANGTSAGIAAGVPSAFPVIRNGWVGRTGASASYGTQDIADVLIYTEALTVAQLDGVMAELGAVYESFLDA